MNVNKLFPRLPIRIKLAIAFAALATIPLLVTGALGTRVTLRYIEATAKVTLDHDLRTASERTERFLATAEEDMAYLTEGFLRRALDTRRGLAVDDTAVEAFLRAKPSFVQIKLFDRDGELLLLARASGGAMRRTGEGAGGAYYTYRARSLQPGEHLLMPVEVRAERGVTAEGLAVPAIAIVYPLHDSAGDFMGVAVGEAYASSLFTALESGSPQLAGITGLVGADGRFLYHSERKKDWSSLLATRPDVNLFSDFEPRVAQEIVSGRAGTMAAERGRLVAFAPLHLRAPGGVTSLFLYRSVPMSSIKKPARRFLWGVGGAGVLVLGVALTLAVAAATHFTRPIYRLREGARRLAGGDFDHRFAISTNDELEDLAADFAYMANRLREHTQGLEDLVALRTAELREAHVELQEILSHSEDAIIRLESDGRVRVWNRGAEKLFGYSAREMIGREVNKLLLPPGREGRREAAFIARELRCNGSLVDYHTRRLRKDGKPIAVSLSQTMIRAASGEPLGCTLIIRDVTRQKSLERQMLRSERLAAAGRLAAGIAHEISNPIGIALNRLDCLDLEIGERCPDCPIREDLKVIRDQIERVSEVARRLLSIARDEPDVREPLDLNELVGRVIRFLEPTLAKKALQVEWDLANDLSRIQASRQGLEIVVLNLLLNAADASAEGGTVSVATRAGQQAGTVELDVSDTGSGIAVDLRERIFEPFFTTKAHPSGTGLGLAVTRSIVQAHGGAVAVESEPGVRTRFTVTIPVRSEKRGWRRGIFS